MCLSKHQHNKQITTQYISHKEHIAQENSIL